MIGFRRPSPAAIAQTLEPIAGRTDERDSAGRRADLGFSYAEVGATADPARAARLSDRYAVDHRVFTLGRGRACFEAAADALFAWRQFEIPWLELCGREQPVHPQQVVATLTRSFGLWFLNPCRVVYCHPRDDTRLEASFAYGTLEGHVALGEERFRVRLDPAADDAVTFEIFAFSRPAHWTTHVGRPFLRRIQRRFAADSVQALARAIRVR